MFAGLSVCRSEMTYTECFKAAGHDRLVLLHARLGLALALTLPRIMGVEHEVCPVCSTLDQGD